MLLNTYNRLPITFVRGQGCYLYDDKGDAYLDAISGVAVCNLGHSHPDITEVIARQAERLLHVSNLVRIKEQEYLADELLNIAGMHGAFFSNSGSEANEAAVKIARMWGSQNGKSASYVLCFKRAFHGRTLAMIAAGGNPKHLSGFEPAAEGFVHCPVKDIAVIADILNLHPSISAIMIEPIQGEAGVIIHPDNFLYELQELAHKHQCLFILDEVQTGAGRTGRYFNFLHDPRLKPDIVTAAKGLANGIPVGVCLVKDSLADVMNPGSHGCTFGGNPLACLAASKVIEILERDKLYDNATEIGAYMLRSIKEQISDHPRIARIQGQGMMIGVELSQVPPFDLALECLVQDRVFLNLTSGNTIRLLPPLLIDHKQADTIVNAVVRVVQQDSLYNR